MVLSENDVSLENDEECEDFRLTKFADEKSNGNDVRPADNFDDEIFLMFDRLKEMTMELYRMDQLYVSQCPTDIHLQWKVQSKQFIDHYLPEWPLGFRR